MGERGFGLVLLGGHSVVRVHRQRRVLVQPRPFSVLGVPLLARHADLFGADMRSGAPPNLADGLVRVVRSRGRRLYRLLFRLCGIGSTRRSARERGSHGKHKNSDAHENPYRCEFFCSFSTKAGLRRERLGPTPASETYIRASTTLLTKSVTTSSACD